MEKEANKAGSKSGKKRERGMLNNNGEADKSNKRRVKVDGERGMLQRKKNVHSRTYLGQHGRTNM